MKELRLFIAVRPPDDALAAVASVREGLRERTGLEAVRWVRDENLHVTLAFLGATDPARIDEPVEAMERAAAAAGGPIDLELAAPGAFPNLRRPRTLWVGVTDRDGTLGRLEEELHAGLVDLGYELDEKPFRPHITIGYVRKRVDPAQRRAIGDAVGEADSPERTFRVGELVLVKSVVARGGSRYSDLRSVSLES
ncbi:MAG: RNA 2',3'-cyclic phosphodiesterase [Spirochaetota bacterium]